MSDKKKEYLYRYVDSTIGVGSLDQFDNYVSTGTYTTVDCNKHEILSHTPKGVWINKNPEFTHDGIWSDDNFGWTPSIEKKFVLLSARVPWAHKTVEEAKASFLIRKHCQIGHLARQIANVKKAIALVSSEQSEEAIVENGKPVTLEDELFL